MDRKRVFVVGAGFSRSLGGPLLYDLFSVSDPSFYQYLCMGTTAAKVHLRFAEVAAMFKDGKDRGLWAHAEQFLEAVQLAANEDAPLPRFAALIWAYIAGEQLRKPKEAFNDLQDVASAVTQTLALECTSFLQRADLEGERWSPYIRWSRSLGASDTVVSFNYDRVPELLQGVTGSRLRVIRPEEGSKIEDEDSWQSLSEARKAGQCPVLKLHGGVGWTTTSDGCFRSSTDIPSPTEEVLIGVPGPGKLALSKRLGVLWKEADRAINYADQVIFLGYRFPESDAKARHHLLNAVRESPTKPDLDVVLGPATGHQDVLRLTALLGRACAQRSDAPMSPYLQPAGTVHPLFVEDYIDSV